MGLVFEWFGWQDFSDGFQGVGDFSFLFFFVFRNLGFRVWLERVRLGWGFPTRFKWVLTAGSGIRRGWNGI